MPSAMPTWRLCKLLKCEKRELYLVYEPEIMADGRCLKNVQPSFTSFCLSILYKVNGKDATCFRHACRFFCPSVSPSNVSAQIFRYRSFLKTLRCTVPQTPNYMFILLLFYYWLLVSASGAITRPIFTKKLKNAGAYSVLKMAQD